MPKLIHAVFVRDEAHCLNNMLDSVLPYVEDSYILIDDRTTDNTKEIAEARGCHTKLFTFENFAKSNNVLLKWINDKADWVLFIAPDETIDPEFGEMLKTLVPKLESTTVDCIRFPRRHWLDLEKTNEYTEKNWYPDWQGRLLRLDYPRIHLFRYVHELIGGARKTLQIKGYDINHFNLYWKKQVPYTWEEMTKVYDELQKKYEDEKGVNIWP